MVSLTLSQMLGKNTIYQLGDGGPIVKALQVSLARRGYPLNGTGYFGNKTLTALKAFQKRAGLEPDGDFGPLTAAALDLADKANQSSIPAATKAEIARPLWLEAGLQLVGVKETPGTKDTKVIIDWAKAEGGDIAASYTHDVIPWCALFANHLLTKCDLKGTETLWALDFNADRMQKRLGRRWPAKRLSGIAVGAFAPMIRDGGGHIGVVVGRDQHGNVMILGGNQSDAVNIKPFAVSRLNEGFWWPASVPLPMKTGFASLPLVNSNGRVSSNEA